MGPHVVISTFKVKEVEISPPGMWTPPTEAIAAKLIAAKCIRPATEKEETRATAPKQAPKQAPEPMPETDPTPVPVAEVQPKGKKAKGKK